ncbi:MAG: phosphate ABC transporter permease subunit PstC [Thermoproteota archaeon]|nr:MAG: phosphate ABC transporter permease subunit PstC [Candidatus Korarchaeota archaeon]
MDPMRLISLLSSIFILLFIFIALFSLLFSSGESISKFGLRFLTSAEWDPNTGRFGALPAIAGTAITTAISVLIASIIGIGTAVYISGGYSPYWVRRVVNPLIDSLAAVPSVVIGLWGLLFLSPLLESAYSLISSSLGFIPIFGGPARGVSLMTASIILSIMIIPTIASLSSSAIEMVPIELKEGARALGATRWETLRIVTLPYASSYIASSILLAIARAMGETMAVTMVIGNSHDIPRSLFQPGCTITSVIASEFLEATSSLYLSSLMELGLILLAISLLVNIVAVLIRRGFYARA